MITDHSSGVHLAVSAGDRRVLISNSATGQVLQVVTRDSGKLPHLLYHDTELYASSSNGSVRSYTVPHDLKRIAPVSKVLLLLLLLLVVVAVVLAPLLPPLLVSPLVCSHCAACRFILLR